MPVGIVSGVWVWAWIARNWARRFATSVGVKPVVRRRSKPRGAAGVVEVEVALVELGCGLVRVREGWVVERSAASADSAASASEVMSEGDSVSPIEQWM